MVRIVAIYPICAIQAFQENPHNLDIVAQRTFVHKGKVADREHLQNN
jgi:hypothetical protein